MSIQSSTPQKSLPRRRRHGADDALGVAPILLTIPLVCEEDLAIHEAEATADAQRQEEAEAEKTSDSSAEERASEKAPARPAPRNAASLASKPTSPAARGAKPPTPEATTSEAKTPEAKTTPAVGSEDVAGPAARPERFAPRLSIPTSRAEPPAQQPLAAAPESRTRPLAPPPPPRIHAADEPPSPSDLAAGAAPKAESTGETSKSAGEQAEGESSPAVAAGKPAAWHRKIVFLTALFVLVASAYLYVNRPRSAPSEPPPLNLDDWGSMDAFPDLASGGSLQAPAQEPASLPSPDPLDSDFEFQGVRTRGEAVAYPRTETPTEAWSVARDPRLRTSMKQPGATLDGISPAPAPGQNSDRRY